MQEKKFHDAEWRMRDWIPGSLCYDVYQGLRSEDENASYMRIFPPEGEYMRAKDAIFAAFWMAEQATAIGAPITYAIVKLTGVI